MKSFLLIFCAFLFQEGEKFLENEGHTVDGGTRGETEAVKTAIEESEADKQNGEKEEEKPDLKRKGTMQETVEVGKKFSACCLENHKSIFRYRCF